MARLRRRDDNSDHMSRLQDARLLELEASINALYSQAAAEVQAEFARFTEAFEEEDKRQNARMTEGEITPEQYAAWRQNNILRSDKYQATVDSLTTMLVNTDIAAMEITRGQLPIATAESYNFVQALGSAAAEEAGLSMGTFQVYNADSIQAIMRDNRELLPHVDVPEDERWNHTRINREIATGILTGDSIPKVAERLQLVTNMDNNAAVRNARTAMTGAENLGRRESADRLREQGIPIKEVWSATYDNRTRDTHLMMDGTEANEQGLFGVGILTTPLRYPGDPLGDPAEVYNCRCRLNVQIIGIDHSNDADLYEQFMRDNHPDDYAELQDQRDERREAAERREAILAEHPLPSIAELTPADELTGGHTGVVHGQDITETWTRREDQFEFEINDVINAQGFDGLPRVVSAEEFDRAVQESNFIAQRTYSAPDQETLDAYRDQLYNGNWYVDCGTGGAQYGQGMYTASMNGQSVTDSMREEMAYYQEISRQRIGEEGGEAIHAVETMTLAPGTRTIDYREAREELADYLWSKYITEAPGVEPGDVERVRELRQRINENRRERAAILAEDERLANIYNYAYNQTVADNTDVGTFAAMRGFDAIVEPAKTPGDCDYTVILNRSAVIIRRDET